MKQYLLFAFGLIVGGSVAASGLPDLAGPPGIPESARTEVYKVTSPSEPRSGGTGFSVRTPSGQVFTLTNKHVCAVAKDGVMAVWIQPNRAIQRRVLELSAKTDLCLLEGVPGARGLQLADEISSVVLTVGYPYLGPLTPSAGRVLARMNIEIAGDEKSKAECSAKWEEYESFFGTVGACIHTVDSIATSAMIYPGNSGSPALDSSGRVVGVVFAGDSRTAYGFLIPLDHVAEFLSVW